MQKYIGTKLLNAKPMKLKAATELLRRDIGYKGTLDENDDADGYLVKYPDGYQGWSPAYAFEPAYRPVTGMSFGLAVEAMKMGKRVCRAGWNGKGMWLSLSGPLHGRAIAFENFWSNNNSEFAYRNGGSAEVLPCITMKTADNKILMGWLASQTDMLADDWMIVE